ncbi:CRE-AQP-8 protein [Aphelenchoides avenae]|nr:CRE-AQP-8 protein [Aphelenchus avenae]
MRTENAVVREFLAEFIATFFFLLIGTSANVQAFVAPGGNTVSAHLAWGFGFAFAVYTAISVSGAHLNPAISFAAMVNGDLSAPRFVIYTVAQILGAFVGTAATFIGHLDDINRAGGGAREVYGPNSTAGLFATYPAQHMTVLGSLADQIIGTAILAASLNIIVDRRNRVPQGIIPLLAGLIMSMIAMTYGANGGFAINPARDLGPRLFTLCVGYGWEVFSAYDYYFWIPLLGPMIGALIGSWVYKLFVGLHGLNEEIDITGGKPYPRDDRGYKRNGEPGFFPQITTISQGEVEDRKRNYRAATDDNYPSPYTSVALESRLLTTPLTKSERQSESYYKAASVPEFTPPTPPPLPQTAPPPLFDVEETPSVPYQAPPREAVQPLRRPSPTLPPIVTVDLAQPPSIEKPRPRPRGVVPSTVAKRGSQDEITVTLDYYPFNRPDSRFQ